MIRLLIIADVRGWAYDKRAQALKKYAPEDFAVDITYVHEIPKDLSAYDIVYNIDYSVTENVSQRLRNQGARAKLVNSHNADHQRAFEQFETSCSRCDYVICNNYKAWEHFGKRSGTCNISNGVDLNHFYYEDRPESDRALRAVWVGPAGKGLHDILEPLQQMRPDIDFVFRVKTGKEWDPETHMPDPALLLDDNQMLELYRSCRFVICCSETEATPNYLLEAMACGCVPITTRVGNMLEFTEQNSCVFVSRNVEDFSRGIDRAIAGERTFRRLGEFEINKWHWRDRANLFYDLFRDLASGGIPQPFTYRTTMK